MLGEAFGLSKRGVDIMLACYMCIILLLSEWLESNPRQIVFNYHLQLLSLIIANFDQIGQLVANEYGAIVLCQIHQR